MAIKDLFNSGKLTSTGIDEQYHDKFWSKGAIRESQRVRTFTQLGDRLTQPKHYGDEIVKERQFPILHPMNKLDGGIDATTATLVLQTFYAYNASGALVGTFEARDYATATAAENAAKGAATGADYLSTDTATDIASTSTVYNVVDGLVYTANVATNDLPATDFSAGYDAGVAATGKVQNGAGSLYNGDADFSVISGTFPTLTEEGGNVNGVNTKSVTVRGNVSEFGLHLKFTQKSIDMDTRTGVLAQKTKALGEAKGDIYEKQVAADLLSASEVNRTYAGVNATGLATCDQTAKLAFADLRLMEQELKRLLVPRDTKIISGSTKIGTTVIGKSYYVYVGQELLPMLEDMQHNGVNVWRPIEAYKDAAGTNVAEGEVGAIGRFRFIEVAGMVKYRGAGAEDETVQTWGTSDITGYHSSTVAGGGATAFDVFPVLFVGSDSFATVGFEGDSAQIKTAMPKADAHNDPFGKNGSMSISWYFGTLIYKAERIRQIACTATLS